MVVSAVLLLFLAVASYTDIRWHKIYNWNTYPGILVGLAINAWLYHWEGLQSGLLGFLLCGFVMLFCFVLFNVGGGDVKLIAMMGAFLGLEKGVEAMLWTFVFGAVMGTVMIIWRHGVFNILSNTIKHLRLVFRARGWVPLTEEERRPLRRWLFLAPSAFAAVCVLAAEEQFGFFKHWLGRM